MAGQGVFPQYMVSKLAREKVTVVLGGQGADEIFGGYTRYYALLLDQSIRNNAKWEKENIGISLEELGQSIGQLKNYASLWCKMQGSEPFEEPILRYWKMIDRSGDLNNHLTDEFIKSLEGYSPYDTYREYMAKFPKAELLNRILYFEASCWLPALLHIEDRVSMAVSLESRVPFLDVDLIRFAFNLPTGIKLKAGKTKSVMRAAFQRELASEIRDRNDKVGFPVPTNRWFEGALYNFVGDILMSKESRNRGIFKPQALIAATNPKDDQDRSVWGMLNMELWHQNLKSH
jgi:asparagine synthase (glutamine-hydrolysing)